MCTFHLYHFTKMHIYKIQNTNNNNKNIHVYVILLIGFPAITFKQKKAKL
jgi:hypothetical protein